MDEITNYMQARKEEYELRLTALERHILGRALQDYEEGLFATYGRRVMGDTDGDPEHTKKMISATQGLGRRVTELLSKD